MRNVDVRTGRDELHIASFVVQHRAEAMPALAAHVAATAGMELALPGEVRSVGIALKAPAGAVTGRVDVTLEVATLDGTTTVAEETRFFGPL